MREHSMAKDNTASVVRLRQPPMSPAERARNYRRRKKQTAGQSSTPPSPTDLMALRAEPACVTSHHTARDVSITSRLLVGAALALAVVGLTMNGWFARSLGSTDL